MPGVEAGGSPSLNGEILIRGEQTSFPLSYWNNPEATRLRPLVDGWLHNRRQSASSTTTGYLKITGRKRRTSSSPPGGQEPDRRPTSRNDLKASPFISPGRDGTANRRPYPVALITLDPEEILPWAARAGAAPGSRAAGLGADQVVAPIVQAELDRANANFAQVEQDQSGFAILKGADPLGRRW